MGLGNNILCTQTIEILASINIGNIIIIAFIQFTLVIRYYLYCGEQTEAVLSVVSSSFCDPGKDVFEEHNTPDPLLHPGGSGDCDRRSEYNIIVLCQFVILYLNVCLRYTKLLLILLTHNHVPWVS